MALFFSACGKKNNEEEVKQGTEENQQPDVMTTPAEDAAKTTPEETQPEQQEGEPAGTEGENGEDTEQTGVLEPEETEKPEETEEPEQSEQPQETAAAANDRGIDPEKPMVCLTFDDGPSDYTDDILDVLDEYGAKATFFEVGQNVQYYGDAVRRELEMGMQLGSHSWSHQDLGSISEEAAIAEIQKADDIIVETTGEHPSCFRPPYGSLNGKSYLLDVPIITWSVDTLDWSSRDADAVMQVIYDEGNLDGKCILMHSLYASTLEALKTMVPYLVEQGYQLVTVSEMAEYRHGETLQPGEWYGYEYFQ